VRRRRSVVTVATAGIAVLVVALVLLLSVVSKIFGGVSDGLDKNQLGLNGPPTTTTVKAPAQPGSLVKPTRATVFSPDGSVDNPGQAGLAIDGNPSTFWSTETYTDRVPFPGFKQGEGLLLELPNPTVVGQVTVDILGTGTKVEIRAASTPTPAKLDDTVVLAPAFALKPGHNVIPVAAGSPTSNLLVWISTLGTTNGKSQACIAEITVRAAS